MRTHGTLTEWNDDRGFGFIAATQGGEKVFVHVSAFPRDGQRPRVGELISFEIEKDSKGKPRAVHVMRPGAKRGKRHSNGSTRPERPARTVPALLSLIAIAAIAAYLFAGRSGNGRPITAAPAALPAKPVVAPRFTCDGRTTCSQMTSCAEAKYFLQHCPDVTMDGNHDGEPCEQQWCNVGDTE